MRLRIFALGAFFLVTTTTIAAQNPAGTYNDPIGSMAGDLNKIERSVNTLSERLKAFIDKFEKAPGVTITEKQRNMIVGLQILADAEQLLATRQRTQIELVEKQGATRTRLAQVERDVTPQSIDRSVAFEGTTKTEELRENRRNALQAEREALRSVMAQIASTLSDVNDSVREAQQLVIRLRRTYIPQLERDLVEQ